MDNYKLLDCGNFRKLEQIGSYKIVRPSPAAVWRPIWAEEKWKNIDCEFKRFSDGNGEWRDRVKIDDEWQVNFDFLKLNLKRTSFGHLGVFAEQMKNWQQLKAICEVQAKPIKVLNLFAYTGGASIACALGGAQVTHVDASKTSVSWARENGELNGVDNMRLLVEDVSVFVKREIKRGNKYQGVILDPPSYGRGPKNQVWKIEENLVELLSDLREVLAEDYQFVLISSHSNGYTPIALKNMLLNLNIEKGEYLAEEMLVRAESGVSLPSGASCFYRRFN